jgi:hypothetical protein
MKLANMSPPTQVMVRILMWDCVRDYQLPNRSLDPSANGISSTTVEPKDTPSRTTLYALNVDTDIQAAAATHITPKSLPVARSPS